MDPADYWQSLLAPSLYLSLLFQGSDPLQQTVRGRHQNRKHKLTAQINRELRMRAGAENLHKATTNRRLRDSVALELRLVNSNLQLLKEELADLNSSVDLYQNESCSQSVPMIPLGLKETNDLPLTLPMSKFIVDHYKESASSFQHQIQRFIQLRQASRTPERNEDGVRLLLTYYNHLYFIEKRFFPAGKGLGIDIEWYDAITGIPCCQRTIIYEKGAILFNLGSLYTQIGAKQDRTTASGLTSALESFQRAAGAFRTLHESFSNAPSTDMQPTTLEMLTELMLAQSQECCFERRRVQGIGEGLEQHIITAQEAAMVAQLYSDVHRLMSTVPLKDYIPVSWTCMIQVKSLYFQAMAHVFLSEAILDQPDSANTQVLSECFPALHSLDSSSLKMPQTADERRSFGEAHLREGILKHEEALRVHGTSKQLRKMNAFLKALKQAHDRSLKKFSQLEDEDDFSEITTVPRIRGRSKEVICSLEPDFTSCRVTDLFHSLGPLAIFSANHVWSHPKDARLEKESPSADFGFSVRGEAPVLVAQVDEGSIAQAAGMKTGDFLISVANEDVKWMKHSEVVSIVKAAGNVLCLTFVTPVDCDYLSPAKPSMSAPDEPVVTVETDPPIRASSTSPQGFFKKRLFVKTPKDTSSATLQRKKNQKT
ncbi:hypothetical protein CAPTEDRAFT_93887 [Capitella teleta]|uniref:Uncharacterized protein n=1 Tax=Capitella teleta TaxID=283909 RepID=R7UNA7_CAPTE|nr:hypothetical protein CAPTEDRAFT_93887 [Capitella teleta]|eukprot:ELU08014.1 hypothetical protein CAPTEDRAFT_93887 [Capitella teleta]